MTNAATRTGVGRLGAARRGGSKVLSGRSGIARKRVLAGAGGIRRWWDAPSRCSAVLRWGHPKGRKTGFVSSWPGAMPTIRRGAVRQERPRSERADDSEIRPATPPVDGEFRFRIAALLGLMPPRFRWRGDRPERFPWLRNGLGVISWPTDPARLPPNDRVEKAPLLESVHASRPGGTALRDLRDRVPLLRRRARRSAPAARPSSLPGGRAPPQGGLPVSRAAASWHEWPDLGPDASSSPGPSRPREARNSSRARLRETRGPRRAAKRARGPRPPRRTRAPSLPAPGSPRLPS